jgi:eukaryotic-like serine/threonine-protein kinase
MALSAGSRLGHYEILTPIGAGGMGEVYKARDTRLDRTVAIKVLPDRVATDPEARVRLEREAKAISQLNHPHICTLYDLGRDPGGDPARIVDYLVLEYLEGQTLARRLEAGPLSVEETLKIAMQIADALDKAHRHGIIHRDLKPGNVMITGSGAKLLDFGLAKTLTQGQDVLLTRTTPLTAQGTILGTFQYMAPEQIEGADLDARGDIWAFGCVLFEMLTGRTVFIGKTQASLIGAILKDAPASVTTIQPLTPPVLDRIVRSCLAKDPQDRFDTAHDLLLQLRWIAEGGSAAGLAAPVVVHRKRRERLAWAAVGFAALALIAAMAYIATRPSAEERTLAFPIVPPKGSSFTGWTLSPDGTRLAFVAAASGQPTRIWIRALDEIDARPLPGTEGARDPFWSPDGRQLGFFAERQLKKIDVSGGSPVPVTETGTARVGGSWNASGDILFGGNPGISRVASTGGVVALVTKSVGSGRVAGHRWPQFLPDGRHFLFFNMTSGGQGLAIASLDDPTPRLLMNGTSTGWYDSGQILFVRNGTLFAQTFDADTARFVGDQVVVAQGVGEQVPTGRIMVSSAPGILAFGAAPAAETVIPIWFDRAGTNLGPALPADVYQAPSLSTDGKQLVAHRQDPKTGNSDVWTFSLDTKIPRRLTSHPADDQAAIWSSDARRIVFGSMRDTPQRDLYVVSATAPDTEELLFRSPNYKTALDWSRDGKYILYSENSGTQSDLFAIPLEGERKPVTVAATKAHESGGHFSPDGKWIAYVSDVTGREEIYVTSFPPSREVVPVSSGGGIWPIWSADGREIFFLDPSDQLMSVTLRFDKGIPAPATPTPLFRARIGGLRILRNYYEYWPEGGRFLIMAPADQVVDDAPIKVVVNWRAKLGR